MGYADDDVRIAIQRVARRIRNSRAEGDIGETQLSVLFHLHFRGPRTPSELANHERVTPPSMNRALNALEEAGYVTRERATDDARKVLVTITPLARELIAETRRQRTEWFSRQLAALTPEERAALEAALPVLAKLAES